MSSLKNTVKAIASLNGLSNQQLADALGLAFVQSLLNKYSRNSFSGQDLLKIAKVCNCELAFVDRDGRVILRFPSEEVKK